MLYTLFVYTLPYMYTYLSSSTYQQDGVTIHHRDLRRLVPDVYLNDSLIDFRIKHVFLNLVEEKRAKVHVFSSLFYTKVRDLFSFIYIYLWVYTECYIISAFTHLHIYIYVYGVIILTPYTLYTIQLIEKKTSDKLFYDNVRTWTKGVDLFSQDYIIVPINLNGHWSLIVIIRPRLVKVCY